MKFNFLKYVLFLLSIVAISSCVSKKKYNDLGQYYENVENDLRKAKKQIEELKQELALRTALGDESKDYPITTYKFDKLNHNFGFIALGYEYKHTFTFTNTGSEKLVFTSVKGSCTCTVPEYTKEAIEPGETGTITVKFTPGMPLGEQTKYVTITANTKRKIAVLSVSGTVRDN